MEKVEKQRQVGMAYYGALCDAAGYPNGMPYWHEMGANDKYYYCLVGLDVLVKSAKLGFIPEIDFAVSGTWGQGDCKALMDYLEEKSVEEKAEFERRLEKMQALFKEQGG